MFSQYHRCGLLGVLLIIAPALQASPLGLPPVPVPEDNPQSPAKIELGEKLFNDTRFSTTGDVSCATCHDPAKAFTDSPLAVSEGIHKARGTRNAPSVINAAYSELQFWDGREPDLERQSTQPFINPIEMGLTDHQPILDVVRDDRAYQKLFRKAFDVKAKQITMTEVTQALAAFERTIISGNSPFDRYYCAGDKTAMSESAIRGFEVFLGDGRCVSCHTISQDHALFTDHRFHNINVGFPAISAEIETMAKAFARAKDAGTNVDVAVLSNRDASELGRFAVDERWAEIGAFKTPTLRNIELTAPYMHDGSLATLEEVVDHYNNGGKLQAGDPAPSGFLSGGIRPLELSDQQKADLVAFMEALTSPEIREQVATLEAQQR